MARWAYVARAKADKGYPMSSAKIKTILGCRCCPKQATTENIVPATIAILFISYSFIYSRFKISRPKDNVFTPKRSLSKRPFLVLGSICYSPHSINFHGSISSMADEVYILWQSQYIFYGGWSIYSLTNKKYKKIPGVFAPPGIKTNIVFRL